VSEWVRVCVCDRVYEAKAPPVNELKLRSGKT